MIADDFITRTKSHDVRFPAAFACAFAVHVALILWATAVVVPRQMGEQSGQADGVTVEIVDASDLPNSPSAQPAAAPPPAPQPALKPPAPEPAPQSPPAEPASQPVPLDTKAPEPKSQTAPPLPDYSDPDLFSLAPKPDRPEHPSAAQSTTNPAAAKPAKPAQRAPQFSLALPSTPTDVPIDLQGRSAAVSRPEGITRSGLNDAFGRGVISALRQTMPGPDGTLGSVVVRFELSPNGDLVHVEVIRGSGDAMLDRSVLFSVKQASFPIPPGGSVAADRFFRVTYIYK